MMHSNRPAPNLPATAPNLYLVGFMGTGKSVVGQRVSQMLGFPFIDSDKWIENREGQTIPEIFASLGEPGFRELERQFIQEHQPPHRTVVSTGGGLVTNPVLRDHMKRTGVVVVLYATVETLLRRLSGDENRPLMKNDDPRARIEQLLADREQAYKQAGVGIMTDWLPISDVAEHVVRIYLDKART